MLEISTHIISLRTWTGDLQEMMHVAVWMTPLYGTVHGEEKKTFLLSLPATLPLRGYLTYSRISKNERDGK
jgi:hypothetical protein